MTAGQTRYHVYRFTLVTGKQLTGCATSSELWEAATDSHVLGNRTWITLTKWDGTNPWRQEAETGRFIEVNLDHVAGVEKWEELR